MHKKIILFICILFIFSSCQKQEARVIDGKIINKPLHIPVVTNILPYAKELPRLIDPTIIPYWLKDSTKIPNLASVSVMNNIENKDEQEQLALIRAKKSLINIINEKLDKVVQRLHRITPDFYRDHLADAKKLALKNITKDLIAGLGKTSSYVDEQQNLYILISISYIDKIFITKSVVDSFLESINNQPIIKFYVDNEEQYVRESISRRLNMELNTINFKTQEERDLKIRDLKIRAQSIFNDYVKYSSYLRDIVSDEFN